MNPLKVAIFKEVRSNHENSRDLSDDELNKLLFHHTDGLRLSYTGFLVLKNIFTVYSFEIPSTLKSKHRFGLSKLEFPYFFTANRLILFSEMDSVMVALVGGIEGFLETCSKID